MVKVVAKFLNLARGMAPHRTCVSICGFPQSDRHCNIIRGKEFLIDVSITHLSAESYHQSALITFGADNFSVDKLKSDETTEY